MVDDYTDVTRSDIRLDTKAVRILAHPLRSRILSHLRTRGPATATQLASALTTNTGATSYHLWSLESVGLVVDTEEGTGRQRIWKVSSRSHSWKNAEFSGDDDAEAAFGLLRRDYVRQFAA